MYTWDFNCRDNGGKRQFFKVKANDKPAAINKALKRAEKNAKGDIIVWECNLIPIF